MAGQDRRRIVGEGRHFPGGYQNRSSGELWFRPYGTPWISGADMKTSFEFLPERKQRERVRIAGIIQKKFADLVARSASDARPDGRIFKIILFGLGRKSHLRW